MKRTQITELFANIRATAVSFFSIVMFVALGIAIFLGLRWGSASLTTRIDDVLNAQRTPDIEITYPFGLTEDDIEAVRAIDGIDIVEGTYVTFAETNVLSGRNTLRVQELADTMGTPEVISGRLPEAPDEIAVLSYWAALNQVNVGDVLELKDPSGLPYLARSSFTVVGTVTSGDFLARAVDVLGDAPAELVHGARVAVEPVEERKHHVAHLGRHARGRVVVEIHCLFHWGYYTTFCFAPRGAFAAKFGIIREQSS